ncbi:MAG: oligosaccharide flippase family protein [Hyphomonadaceae bacterium]
MLNYVLLRGEQGAWLRRRAIASVKPLAALWGAAGLAVILGAAGQLLLARALGPAGFGVFITANSVANMLGPFAAYGVGLMLIQKYGNEGWGARRWVAPSLRICAAFLLATTAAFFAWCATALDAVAERQAAFLLAPLIALFAGVQLAESRFQLEHRYVRVAGWQLSKHFAIFGTGLMAAAAGWTLLQAALGLSVASAVIAGFAFWAGSGFCRPGFLLKGHSELRDASSPAKTPSYVTILSEAWPFAATSFVFLFFFQSSVVIVQWVAGSTAAGVYGVAVAVMTAVYLLPRILYRKFFLAKVSRWHYQDRARVDAFTWRIVPTLAVLSAPLAAAIIVAAPFAVKLTFGPEFAGATLPLQILSLAVPFRFFSAGLTVAAVETGHVRERVIWQFAIAIMAVVATTFMLPRFGIAGAAAVMVMAEMSLACAYWRLALNNRAAVRQLSTASPQG